MLLARTAQSIYWAGRYLERAEDLARVVLVHGDSHVDLPVGEDVGWAPLLAVVGADDLVPAPVAPGKAAWPSRPAATEAVVVELLLVDAGRPYSVLSALSAARENLRAARVVVPREAWELCNDLWRSQSESRELVHNRHGRVRWLRHVIDACQRLNGAVWGTMQRDEALAIALVGQLLERADLTCRVLQARADTLAPDTYNVGPNSVNDAYDEVRVTAILRSLAGYQSFRRTAPGTSVIGSAITYLLLDRAFPRSVAACLTATADELKHLPRNEAAIDACAEASMLLTGTIQRPIAAEHLRSTTTRLLSAIGRVHDAIHSTYFDFDFVELFPPARTSGPGAASLPFTDAPPSIGTGAATADIGTRRYRVTHTTTYRYAGRADQSYNEAHLHPRPTPHQSVLSHHMEVDPRPYTWSEAEDVFRNIVTTFVVRGSFDHMSVTSTSEVAVSPCSPPPAAPPWESVRALLERDPGRATKEARRYRAPSRLIEAGADFAHYAQESFTPSRPCVEAVVDLCSRIHSDFTYDPGFTSVTTPVEEVFEARRGVCQDFAHLTVACLRSMALAARYVSGYIDASSGGSSPSIGGEASHAWASVYLPGWGWLDIDPTNDQLVSTEHVVVAWGRDYNDVSPLRGHVEGAVGAHALDVDVQVRRLS